MGRKKYLTFLARFKKSLNKKLDVKKMYLFGSQAIGKANEGSDFDLLVVSPDFRGKKFRYRSLGFHNYWTIDYPVDFLCYTPEEFERKKKQIGIVRQAAEEGIEI